MRTLCPSILVCLLSLAAPSVRAAPVAAFAAGAPHLRVELLAEELPLAPGSEVQLGLRFILEPGWHIYWSNPGDSGQPPHISWSLPSGADKLHIGELRWPTPHRLATGPLVDYGYEGEVMLLAPLHVDADAALHGDQAVTAAVNWLVCSESCIPGKAQLTRILPVRAEAPGPGVQAPSPAGNPPPPATATAALFAAAENALPQPPPPDLELDGVLDASTIHLHIDLGVDAKTLKAQFFPAEPAQVDNAAPQIVTAAGSVLSLQMQRSEQLVADISRLRGLLVLDAAGQPTRSFAVAIPLRSALAPAVPPKTVAPLPAAPLPTLETPARPAPAAGEQLPLGLALLFALLGGALLNLMPCVFPVLSIKALALIELSGAERAKARLHGLLYAAGILVSFWALAGLLLMLRYAGQQIGWGFHLQSPEFVIGLCVLLFLLGLNLLGVFEIGIGLTQLGQATVGRNGAAGAFATGVLATVVATPCTAPFMGTAVGFALSQSALVALLTFTLLGLGLALPYVLLLWVPGGQRILPRPGRWMETFKQVMGFLLLATVLWLAWVLGGQGGVDAVIALLGGLLLAGVAGWVLQRWSEQGKKATAAALALVLVGLLIPIWQISGTKLQANTAASRPGDDDLPWESFTPAQLAAYRRAGKAVLLDFTANWCVSCKVNERLVLRSQEVRARIRELGVIPMKADWTNEDPTITQALAEFGRAGVPFYVLYGRDANTPPIQLPVVLSKTIVLRALDQIK